MPRTRKIKRVDLNEEDPIESDDDNKANEDEQSLLQETEISKKRKTNKKDEFVPLERKYTFHLGRLLVDKSKKAIEEEEELNSSIDSDSLSRSQDAIDEERLTQMLTFPDELAVETQIEYFFSHWPKKLPQPELTVNDIPSAATKEQAGLLEVCKRGKEYQHQLLIGGWIANCHQNGPSPCPKVVVQWCFQTMAFAGIELATAAFRTLETLLLVREPLLPFVLEYYPSTDYNVRDTPLFSEWTPEYNDFIEIFEAYGVEVEEYKKCIELSKAKKVIHLNASPEEDEANVFPAQNVALVVRYLGLCVRHCPSRFTAKQVQFLIQLLCRALLDPQDAHIIGSLQSTIASLLSYFPDSEWENRMCLLCEVMYNTVTASHQNYSKVVQSVPLTTRRGRELRGQLGFYFLHQLFHMKYTPSLQPISIPLLINLVKKIQINNTTDYSLLSSIVSLIPLCINDRTAIKNQSESLNSLRTVLQALNMNVKEISGYNLLVTKVKDMLVLMTSSFMLLANQGKRATQPLLGNKLTM